MESAYNGVRAEPKFLKDPTSLESISSGISRLSSYVTSNLSKKRQSMASPMDTYYAPPPLPVEESEQESEEDEADNVLFSAFDTLHLRHDKRNCLLMGYNDGFQIWDVTNPDNVHELCSVRDKERFGSVTYIHCLCKTDEEEYPGPLLAIVSEKEQEEPNKSNDTHQEVSKASIVRFYSLQTQEVIKEISDFDDEDDTIVTCIQSNHKVIVLGCLSHNRSSLYIISAVDFKLNSTLTDVYHENGPIFTLGARFIAYATNTPVLNTDPVMSSLTNKGLGLGGVLQGDKDVKGAAKDIAKEVVSGVKSLSELGYSTLSNYFNNGQNEKMYATSPTNRRNSASPRQPETFYNGVNSNGSGGGGSSGNSSSNSKKLMPSGMIMIRDLLKLPTPPSRHLSTSIVAHFRPHTHPLSCLAFNQAGTLLISASRQGHTFHVFSILTNTGQGNVSHLYSLSRGFTDAQVEDCQFSADSTWCAVSTARGTTHVYAINPYGGKPEIAGHVHGKVNNPVFHPLYNKSHHHTKAVSLNSVIRIKQRRKMPSDSNTTTSYDDLMKTANSPYTPHGYYGPTPPHYPSNIVPTQNNRFQHGDPHAKITSMFVSAPRSPFLVNTPNFNKAGSVGIPTPKKTVSTSSASLDTIKQQATNIGSMLSSFGSSMSQIPSYLPNQNRTSSPKWSNSNSEKSNDTLMFGFDEEYDDSTKMVNDEFGYQDIYSFHPDGVLTLHRCWVVKVVLKKRDNGRIIEKVDLSVKEEDIAEWRVARTSDWEQVSISLDTPPASPQNKKQDKKTKPGKQSAKVWLSNAEITTYVPDEPALWTQHQFSFQTFTDNNLERTLKAGLIPQTETLVMLKGMPEPISSRIDRVRKTSTRIADNNAEENMDDALAELEDNLSNAMQTSFSPSNSIGNSPANLKWLSSSANAVSPTTPRSIRDQHSSVSFEDAYLIHMASDPIAAISTNNNMQNSSLIQFDDSDASPDEDSLRFEQSQEVEKEKEESENDNKIFSPDGDNEMAYPSDSIFGGSFAEDKQSDST
ncbi:hypothetical protein K501DRAFT_320098 [Backusella circina FSU 941]|nr:hypothetical protein K501DRAFT_320098 [Backusella circina FSU 941]